MGLFSIIIFFNVVSLIFVLRRVPFFFIDTNIWRLYTCACARQMCDCVLFCLLLFFFSFLTFSGTCPGINFNYLRNSTFRMWKSKEGTNQQRKGKIENARENVCRQYEKSVLGKLIIVCHLISFTFHWKIIVFCIRFSAFICYFNFWKCRTIRLSYDEYVFLEMIGNWNFF